MPDTVCRDTGKADRKNCRIYEKDLLLYETDQEIGYFIVPDTETAVDIITGEILNLETLPERNIKVIGNQIDFPDFIDGIQNCMDDGRDIPYLPALNTIGTHLPFMKLTCLKCGHVTLSCSFMSVHKGCGGYFSAGFTTKVYRKGEKEKAPA